MGISNHLSEAVSISELFTVRLGWRTEADVPLGFPAASPLGSVRPTDARDCQFSELIKGEKLSALICQSEKDF